MFPHCLGFMQIRLSKSINSDMFFLRSPCVLMEATAICMRSQLSLWPFRQLSDHIEHLRQWNFLLKASGDAT